MILTLKVYRKIKFKKKPINFHILLSIVFNFATLFVDYDYIIRVFTWLTTGSSWLSLQLVGTHCISSLSHLGSLTAKEPKLNFIGRLQRRMLLINSCLVMLMITDSSVFLRQGQDKKTVQYCNNTRTLQELQSEPCLFHAKLVFLKLTYLT